MAFDHKEERKTMLEAIARRLALHEDENPEDLNLVGCIISFDDEHYEYNGQEFLKWPDRWEVRKAKKTDDWERIANQYRDALLDCRSAISSLRFASPEVADLHFGRMEEACEILEDAETNKHFEEE